MAWKKRAVLVLVVALVASNVATVVWAGCFSTPKPVKYRTVCYDWGEGIQHVYVPDPEEHCGFTINPFRGCYETTVGLTRRVYEWSDPGCTGVLLSIGPLEYVGSITQGFGYVCGES